MGALGPPPQNCISPAAALRPLAALALLVAMVAVLVLGL